LLYAAGQFLPRDAMLARYMPSSCVWYRNRLRLAAMTPRMWHGNVYHSRYKTPSTNYAVAKHLNTALMSACLLRFIHGFTSYYSTVIKHLACANISYFLNIWRHLPFVYLNANGCCGPIFLLSWTFFPTLCKWTLFPSGRYFRGPFFRTPKHQLTNYKLTRSDDCGDNLIDCSVPYCD